MRTRYENLQILRGLACLVVVAYHIAATEAQYGLRFNPLRPVMWFGYAGVDLFFVLSGFIIAATSGAKLGQVGALPGYLGRRIWRIYPTYFVALAFAAGVYAVLCPDPLIRAGWPTELFESLLLLPQIPVPRVLPVTWTLSYEVMFYAAFGLLFLVPKRVGALLLLAWAGVVVGYAITGALPANRFALNAINPFVLEFLAGCLLAWRPVRAKGWQALGLTLAAIAWVGVGSFACFDPDPTRLAVSRVGRVAVFGGPAALLVLAATAWEQGGGRLPWRWLAKLGDASYPVYLVHIPALMVAVHLSLLARMSHSQLGHTIWIALMFFATIAPGLLMHRFVERPLLQLGKRSKPSPAEPPATESVPPRLAA